MGQLQACQPEPGGEVAKASAIEVSVSQSGKPGKPTQQCLLASDMFL